MQSRRSSKCKRERTLVPGRGRSFSQAGARPRERTFVQEDACPRTLVPEAGARPREGDARPEAAGARPRSRRSSSQAEVDACPARQRTFVQNARPEDRTLVQPDTRDARPCRRNERMLVHARGRSSMQEDVRPAEVDVRPLSASREFHARARDFTVGAHGGREELVGTSPPLPLGLLLLPSSMFVSFRVLHGNGEPNPSCWD
ncbi:hypothetical protein LR48_Vigan10g214500 [Vigna angularis]|uniref:Uncharacterized protein n=1 Tax=Phaseolus angularis TaxID=3914 RepID=A0A0L9VMR6_PHAAN|nr:hypothetical protein LR48_Vigan10g214500 [Vigna angularis]